MDSSNVDVVTTGDIEAQQSNPNWFIDHKHMLRPNQEYGVNNLGYFILKVPEYRRQPPKAFSPQGWRFGLHNRENLDSKGSEAIKLALAVQYGLVGEKWVEFCDAIVDDPKAMLACYGLQSGMTNWTNEQIKHILALDALLLATYMDLPFLENERRLVVPNILPFLLKPNDVFFKTLSMWMDFLRFDLTQVENQIPFVLIVKAGDYINNVSALSDLQYQQRSVEYVVRKLACCFMSTSSEDFKIDNSNLSEKTHMLGAVYKSICGSEYMLMNISMQRRMYIHIPSATKLKQSGIKIVGVDGPLYTMSFKKKCLSLPKMRIFDSTSSFIQNMSWYEKTSTLRGLRGCLFHDYIFLMSDLIQAPEDLDLLIKHGVIYNACGIKGFEMWIALNEGLPEISSSKIHHDMKETIVSRCGLARHSLWSEFKIVFCSKPWVVMSTIAVVLVTVATLIQTYVAITSSNKMKPQFP